MDAHLWESVSLFVSILPLSLPGSLSLFCLNSLKVFPVCEVGICIVAVGTQGECVRRVLEAQPVLKSVAILAKCLFLADQ